MTENIERLKNEAIKLALAEDCFDNDHTSVACIGADVTNRAQLRIKEACVLSGIEVARCVFEQIDRKIVFSPIMSDGQKASVGDTAFTVEGNARNILRAERVVLNLMQRMSGIATNTSRYVSLIEETGCKILDTRKTAPCLRYFDKEAVKHGGGTNHRYGLWDMILIKDNHVDYAGGIETALRNALLYNKENNKSLLIEVEVRTLDDLRRAIEIGGMERIMLDNFSLDQTREAVSINNHRFPLESSGGITYETIRDYALCGVDYVSVGALTHNVKCVDLSLKAF